MTHPSCVLPVKFLASNTSTPLVFIDSQVENYQSLITGVKAGIEVIVLDSTKDGIQQITRILQQRPQSQTVHLVAHGSPGCLKLGNRQLKLETLEEYKTQLKGWSIRSLCLYACQVGKGDKGEKFIEKLHQLTQTFIAASAYRIGKGNWQLEKTTHPILEEIPFQPEVIASYAGVLAEGDLDISFGGGDGIVTTDFGTSSDKGYSVAVQGDGKILVAGYSFNGSNDDLALVRYNWDGTLDSSFSSDGKVTTPLGAGYDSGVSVAVQEDGKILVAGESYNGSNLDIALVRYNADGTTDGSFSSDGIVTTPVGTSHDFGYSVAVQEDGKILVAGSSYNGSYSDFALVRYNTDGTTDTSFDTDGKVTTPLGISIDLGRSVAVQADGKILVAGTSRNGTNRDFALVRYNTDGTLDTSFDSDGKVTTPVKASTSIVNSYHYSQSVAVQVDGKILVAGDSKGDFALVRYNADGTTDNSFNTDGIVTTDFGTSPDYGWSVAVQADGKILVGGYSYNGSNWDFALLRYEGTPVDTSSPGNLVGTANPNNINNLAGNDTIDGLGSNDTLTGGDGNDLLIGHVFFDSFVGRIGNDTLAATSAADIVYTTGPAGLLYHQNSTASDFDSEGQFLALTNKPALTVS